MSKIQINKTISLSEQHWRKAILPVNVTIEQAIRNLEQTALKIVLIVGKEGELLGTISDGDIRRGILQGLNMTSPVENLIYRNPLVVPPEISRELVLQLMLANKVQQIPVVDEHYRVLGIHLWDEVNTRPKRPNPIVIMAGGKGTRLHPFTKNCPKPMLPIAGKPMLEHIIERAKLEGFDHFILAIHYLGEMIENYFEDGSRWQVKIEYLREESALGTGGALGLLYPLPEFPFLVTNGDVLTDIRYGELLDFHERHDAVATMAVRMYEWQHPFGVVQTSGVEIIGFEEKPISRTHINAGVYVLSPQVISELGINQHCDMPTLFECLQTKGFRTIAYPMHEPWLDVGRPADYEQAQSSVSGMNRENGEA